MLSLCDSVSFAHSSAPPPSLVLTLPPRSVWPTLYVFLTLGLIDKLKCTYRHRHRSRHTYWLKCWNVFEVELLLMCSFPHQSILFCTDCHSQWQLPSSVLPICVCVSACVQSSTVVQCGNLPVATWQQTLTVLLTDKLLKCFCRLSDRGSICSICSGLTEEIVWRHTDLSYKGEITSVQNWLVWRLTDSLIRDCRFVGFALMWQWKWFGGSDSEAHCLFQTEKENKNNLNDKWHGSTLDILQSKKQNTQTGG